MGTVTVWNRTIEKAQTLVEMGTAAVATSSLDAVSVNATVPPREPGRIDRRNSTLECQIISRHDPGGCTTCRPNPETTGTGRVTSGYLEGVVDEKRLRRPFWMHQLGEYLIAAVLIASAWYSPEPMVQATLGSLIIINAAFTDGPAGAFRLIDRKLHKWFDVAIMALLLVAAFQGWFDVNSTGRIALPVMAVLMFLMWFHTDFDDKEQPSSA